MEVVNCDWMEWCLWILQLKKKVSYYNNAHCSCLFFNRKRIIKGESLFYFSFIKICFIVFYLHYISIIIEYRKYGVATNDGPWMEAQ